ncbi:MAG: glycosyltransferase family 4 protein [Actinomycetota bacterium]|nr:glycosyltransferase family 4 protein [Actinomycetota bacterium]
MGEGRVLQLLGPSSGGIRRHVAHLAERLQARSWDVTVGGPAGVLDGLAPLDHEVDVPSGADAGALVRSARSLRAAVAGVDLVHAHGLKAGWLASSLRPRPPLVVTVHNLVLPEVGAVAPVLQALEAGLPARADAVIAVSRQIARRFSGARGAGRITVVAPASPPPRAGCDREAVRARLGVEPGEELVVGVGRLHPQKGFDVLVEAMAELDRRRPRVRLALVGAGPAEGELRRQVVSLGLGEVVTLVGASPCAADELGAADVMALASRWEGWPLVVAEAVALGTPVVATAVGGVPEVVVDGVTGRLVVPGCPAALADGLEAVLADPAGARRRAEAARRYLQARFPPAALVGGVEEAYALARQRPRRSPRPVAGGQP